MTKIFFKLFFLSFLSMLTACGSGNKDSGDGEISSNIEPAVVAGNDITINENEKVELFATASDADGIITGHQWVQISGPPVILTSANSANAHFTAPTVLLNDGEQLLKFKITVKDNEGAAAEDELAITVNPINLAPTIEPVEDISVESEDQVNILVSALDQDGSINTYLWLQHSGTPVQIDNINDQTASFTAPSLSPGVTGDTLIFEIIVTDNEDISSSSTILVNVKAPSDFKPATIRWSAPTENEDGSLLRNLTGYNIYYGTSIDNLDNKIIIDAPLITEYILEGLSISNTYYFAVSAINSLAQESHKSEIVELLF